MKVCKKCGVIKSETEFRSPGVCKGCAGVRQKLYRLIHGRHENPARRNETKRVWNKKNRERVRNNIRKSTYGLSSEQFNNLYKNQSGKCAICSKSIYDGTGRGSDALVVDHCHKSGKIRGLLCGGCNSGIGHLGDDAERIKSALLYIEKHS